MEGERKMLACSSHCGRPQPMSISHPSLYLRGLEWTSWTPCLCSMCAHKPWCSLPLSLVSILMGERKFLSTWLVAFLSFWEIPDALEPVPGILVAEKMTRGIRGPLPCD